MIWIKAVPSDEKRKECRQVMSHKFSKPVPRFGKSGAVPSAAPMLQTLKQFFDWRIFPAGREQSKNAHHALQVATADRARPSSITVRESASSSFASACAMATPSARRHRSVIAARQCYLSDHDRSSFIRISVRPSYVLSKACHVGSTGGDHGRQILDSDYSIIIFSIKSITTDPCPPIHRER